MDRLVLKPEEVATRLGISRSLAYRMIRSGDIPSIRVGKRLRVSVAELEQWIESKMVCAVSDAPLRRVV